MTTATSARSPLDQTAAFLARHPDPAGRFLAVVAGPGEPLAGVARSVERSAAAGPHVGPAHARTGARRTDLARDRAGAGGERAGPPAGPESDDPGSRFVLVLDRDRGTPAGLMRVAGDGPVWTFTPAVVLPRYRGKRSGLTVSTLLYRTLIRLARAEGAAQLTTVMDRAAYRAARLIGLPLQAAEEPWSADTFHLTGDVARFERSLAEQAARLRRAARPGGAEVRRTDQRTLAERRIGADIARRLATGDGLDDKILLYP
ncbi:hypothetical protein [Jidongwangia harbinensis]|uniref:hypothetical protein n=1 Tax=Jidongwangia harbinensis TaxID=2878561 RepID=UPI001CD9482A|nr:hypothetical protein [Jidongwangia harbinensis]MCA2216410.1 hypothetical protein [Jidongwangia harbinensis]